LGKRQKAKIGDGFDSIKSEVLIMVATCKEIGPRIKLTVGKRYPVLEEREEFFGAAYIVLNDEGIRQAYMKERFE
jgi:hypothetical protein